jgi:isochorismate synthase
MKATSRRIDNADLLRSYVPGDGFLFEHGAEGVVGIGAAVTITVPASEDQAEVAASRAREALATIERDDGPAPMVVGALPFDGTSQTTLVIPRTTLLRRDGETWRIDVGEPQELIEFEDPPARTREQLRITAVPEPAAYVEAVEKAKTMIAGGSLQKVVLARMLVAQATHVIDRRALVARMRAREPGAYVFGAQGFLGASPELLVERRGSMVRSRPLAGTIARGSDDDANAAALLASAKDQHEHRIVVEAVRAGMAPVCDTLEVAGPHIHSTSKLHHLATTFTGSLRAPARDAMDIAALLHPTPAVCGTPTAQARAAIGELERIDRALYAGIVGWMDAQGDGVWAVALRCAEVAGRIALVFAGAGIVADSDAASELAETDAKFRAMLEALGYA